MVNKLLMFLAYVAFFVLALMYFTPKTSLYYMLEKELKQYDVIISDEKVTDNGFSLSIDDATVYVKNIDTAILKELDIKLFAFYNAISLKDITLSDVTASFIPVKIKSVDLMYSIIDPLNLKIDAEGAFGTASGSLSISERKLHLDVVPSKIMHSKYKNTMRQLKKQKDGGYSYDKAF